MRNATTRIMTGFLTLLASAARTAAPTVPVVQGVRGVHVIINVTVRGGASSITPTIEGYNELTDTWYTILAGAAISSVSTVILKVFPGATIAANLVANDFLPNQWRVSVAHGNTDSITYSVVANTLEDAG